ncbi:MAG: hypothetical protein ACD_54C00087G0002 [uncultured bacterium]|nr:MAG: hypothetical protein ACD_54C00087G0002 [uncultured bacterium]
MVKVCASGKVSGVTVIIAGSGRLTTCVLSSPNAGCGASVVSVAQCGNAAAAMLRMRIVLASVCAII